MNKHYLKNRQQEIFKNQLPKEGFVIVNNRQVKDWETFVNNAEKFGENTKLKDLLKDTKKSNR